MAEGYAAAGLWYDAIAALSQEPVSPAAADLPQQDFGKPG